MNDGDQIVWYVMADDDGPFITDSPGVETVLYGPLRKADAEHLLCRAINLTGN